MIGTIIGWCVVLALGLTVIWRVDTNYRKTLENRRREIDSQAADAEVVRIERRNAAQLTAATANERAEFEKAGLAHRAAEERAAAQVATETVQERIEEERRIIAARAEGRAEAARENALRSAISDASGVEALVEAYKAYCQHFKGIAPDSSRRYAPGGWKPLRQPITTHAVSGHTAFRLMAINQKCPATPLLYGFNEFV